MDTVRARDEFIVGVVGWYFNLVIVGLFTFLLGVVPLVMKAMRAGLDPGVGYGVMGFF